MNGLDSPLQTAPHGIRRYIERYTNKALCELTQKMRKPLTL